MPEVLVRVQVELTVKVEADEGVATHDEMVAHLAAGSTADSLAKDVCRSVRLWQECPEVWLDDNRVMYATDIVSADRLMGTAMVVHD